MKKVSAVLLVELRNCLMVLNRLLDLGQFTGDLWVADDGGDAGGGFAKYPLEDDGAIINGRFARMQLAVHSTTAEVAGTFCHCGCCTARSSL